MPKIAGSPLEWGRGTRGFSPAVSSGSAALLTPWFWASSLLNPAVLSHPVCGVCCSSARTLTQKLCNGGLCFVFLGSHLALGLGVARPAEGYSVSKLPLCDGLTHSFLCWCLLPVCDVLPGTQISWPLDGFFFIQSAFHQHLWDELVWFPDMLQTEHGRAATLSGLPPRPRLGQILVQFPSAHLVPNHLWRENKQTYSYHFIF